MGAPGEAVQCLQNSAASITDLVTRKSGHKSGRHASFLHLSRLFLGRFQPVYYSKLIIAIPDFVYSIYFRVFNIFDLIFVYSIRP